MLRDLTTAECEAILARERYAHLACIDGDEPYLVPITYVFENGFFYGFTHKGAKTEALKRNPRMCIQVERVAAAREWESVICWGMFEEVTDPAQVQRVKLLFADLHGKSVLAHEATPVSPLVKELGAHPSGKETVAYRMQPYRVTGRAEVR